MEITKTGVVLGLVASFIVGVIGVRVTQAPSKPATVSGDAYVLLFAAHSTMQDIPPEHQTEAVIRGIFPTLAECTKLQADFESSFTSDQAKKWAADNEVDKKSVSCVAVKF
jgi:hypothetical protein